MGRELSKIDSVAELLRARGSLRPKDLAAIGIPGDYLDRLYRRGLADKVARGLYASPDIEVGEHHSLVDASQLVPNGVVCLLSALRFHDLTTQAPREVWLALPNKAWSPKVASPRLKIVRFSGESLSEMVEVHEIEKVAVRVYSAAKTVADCFKFRNKIGLDVCIEALRDCLKTKVASVDELSRAAKICRMQNVMRPYLETLASLR